MKRQPSSIILEVTEHALRVDLASHWKPSVSQPKIIILAGPNGAGKTTFAKEFLPQEAKRPVFLNADLIAMGLSPFAPDRAAMQAARLMLEAIAAHSARRESFAIETTLSGVGYARQIPKWRRLGYHVELNFLSLPSADMAVKRVAERVRQGGHDIPETTIRRRFAAGSRLFASVYQPLVDRWALYDSAGDTPTLLDCSVLSTMSRGAAEPQPPYADLPANADAELERALAALRRAALRARTVAQQTGTDLIVMRDGKIVRVAVPPKPDS